MRMHQFSIKECLRREYFGQDEGARSTLPGARAYWHQAPKQGFTLRGHRLSSLFRSSDLIASMLTKDEPTPVSSCQKYSKTTAASYLAQGGYT